MKENDFENKINQVLTKMQQLIKDYQSSFSKESPTGNRKIQQAYFKAKEEYNLLRNSYSKYLDEKSAKRNENNKNKIFVNDYATNREIISTTYKRAVNRHARDFARYFGRGMEKIDNRVYR